MSDQDLPLLSNIHEIRARHYLIHLKPNFDTKTIQGKVFIFFESTTLCEKRGKCCIRDCFCLDSEIKDPVSISEHITQVTSIQEEGNAFEKKAETGAKIHYINSKYASMLDKTDAKNKEVLDEKFQVVLDCCDIRVRSVTEASCEGIDLFKYLDPNCPRECGVAINFWSQRKHLPLQYAVKPWCLRIWREGSTNIGQFPRVVCIDYETTPQGKSLLWRSDQEGNPCVFTPAASINNRSLLPCQDPPSAMATWQAWITVEKEYSVSMTGDYRPSKFVGSIEDYMEDTANLQHKNKKCCSRSKSDHDIVFNRAAIIDRNSPTFCFYFHTTMVLPIATIAIAIGKWKTEILPTIYSKNTHEKIEDEREKMKVPKLRYACCHYEYPCHMKTVVWKYETPLCLTYPPSCLPSIKPLSSFLPYAVGAAVHLLGVYPCRRLELVILPPCFGSLGLASPNLIFLSPTVAIDDTAAYIRLAHEISHAWFGINIGAQDWTEEWLSEGFATYMEDSIYAEAAMAYEKAGHTASDQSLCNNPGSHTSHREWCGVAAGSCVSEGEMNSHSSAKIEDYGLMELRHDITVKSEEKQYSPICSSFEFYHTHKFHSGESSSTQNKYTDSICPGGLVMLAKEGAHNRAEFFPGISVCEEENSSQIFEKKLLLMKSPLKLSREKLEELSDLRAHIRYRTLASELENSTEELQTLRPMQGENLVGADGMNYVKNGLNPEKTFLQVHYLKGYFLLKFLSKLVGRSNFDIMMKEYVSVFHGQLVFSKHILDHFISTFPQVLEKGISRETLYSVWLHQPGLNTEIKEMYGNIYNDLVSEVRQHFHFWEQYNKPKKGRDTTVKRLKVQLASFLFSDQLVLLLEYFLQVPKMYHKTLGEVYEYYNIKVQCGDVRHRWCELVIKNHYNDLTEIERFLQKDQAMGVYLYGELMISRKVKHKRLAEKVFEKIKEDMDENARCTVFSMLYGE